MIIDRKLMQELGKVALELEDNSVEAQKFVEKLKQLIQDTKDVVEFASYPGVFYELRRMAEKYPHLNRLTGDLQKVVDAVKKRQKNQVELEETIHQRAQMGVNIPLIPEDTRVPPYYVSYNDLLELAKRVDKGIFDLTLSDFRRYQPYSPMLQITDCYNTQTRIIANELIQKWIHEYAHERNARENGVIDSTLSAITNDLDMLEKQNPDY